MRMARRPNDLFELDDVVEGFNETFERLFSKHVPPASVAAASYHTEATDAGARITVDLPGVDPSDVCVVVERSTLIVEGVRGGKQHRWKFNLRDHDASTIKASLKNGVVTIDVERLKVQDHIRRVIPVEVHK